MNNLDNRFKIAASKNQGVLIAYFPLGEPGLDPIEMAETFYKNGVDVLETGFPVADPFIDGKVVTASMQRILDNGFSPDWYFMQLSRIKSSIPDVSLEVFGYSQLFDAITKDEFYTACSESGVDSVLIADADETLKLELDRELPESIYNLRFIPYNYDASDLDGADSGSMGGYVFFQAADGITGSRAILDDKLPLKIAELKKRFPRIPICPGFGLSTAEHCKSVMNMGGDGVVIGSLIVDTLYRSGLEMTGKLIREIKASLYKSY